MKITGMKVNQMFTLKKYGFIHMAVKLQGI